MASDTTAAPAATLGPLNDRAIMDAIRGAYDLGYEDARKASSLFPRNIDEGNRGREVEQDHGGALIHTLSRRLAAPAAQEAEPAGIRLLSVPDIQEAYMEACRSTDAMLGIPPESSATGRNVRPEHLLHIGRAFEEAVFRKLHPQLSAPRPQADAGAVPEGWRLVPVEPTEAMVHAIRFAGDRDAPPIGTRSVPGETAIPFVSEDVAVRMHCAMLAAAPQAPAAATESVLIDGVAYSVPAAVAGELLRLHMEALAAPAAAVAPAEVADTVDVVGIRANGEYVSLGKMPMPPRMKAREIATSQFGAFQDEDGSDAELCFGAMEELLDWLERQQPTAAAPTQEGDLA